MVSCWACKGDLLNHLWAEHERAHVTLDSLFGATPEEGRALQARADAEAEQQKGEEEVECEACGALNHRADHMPYFKVCGIYNKHEPIFVTLKCVGCILTQRVRAKQALARRMNQARKPCWDRVAKDWVRIPHKARR